MSWYDDDIKEVPDDIRQLLEGYSGLSSRDVVSHVLHLVRSLRPSSYATMTHTMAHAEIQSFSDLSLPVHRAIQVPYPHPQNAPAVLAHCGTPEKRRHAA